MKPRTKILLALLAILVVLYIVRMNKKAREREVVFDSALTMIEPDPRLWAVEKAQARLETGNFMSLLIGSFTNKLTGESFKSLSDVHNYFGIRWFKKKNVEYVTKWTKAHGDTHYRVYSDALEGIHEKRDIVRRLHPKAHAVRKDPEAYIESLSKTWCPNDDDYAKKWLNIYNKIKPREEVIEVKALMGKFLSRKLIMTIATMYGVIEGSLPDAAKIILGAVGGIYVIVQGVIDGLKDK